MAIVKMARAQLTAFDTEKAALLQALQAMGDIHFADLAEDFQAENYDHLLYRDQAGAKLAGLEEELAALNHAIEGLEAMKPTPGLLASLNSALPTMTYDQAKSQAANLQMRAKALEIRYKLRSLSHNKELISQARAERTNLQAYKKLDVTLADLDRLKTTSYALGTIPRKSEDFFRKRLAETEETYFEVLSSDEKNLYFLLLYTAAEKNYVEDTLREFAFAGKKLPYNQTADELSEEISRRIKKLEAENQQISQELEALSERNLDKLKLRAEWLRNEILQEEARDRFIASPHLFMLELYLAEDRTEELKKTLAATLHKDYLLELETVERQDARVAEVPVMLRNNALVTPFENVVETFATPRYDEIDPTPVVMPWYAACFSMMLGDFGYALLIFVFSLIILKAFKLKPASRQTLRFFNILSVPSMFVGLLYGSFFALDIPRYIPLIGLISPTRDTNQMLIFSFAFGLAMLFFGLGVNGYMKIRDKDPIGLLADVISWYLMIVGIALLLFGPKIGLSDRFKPVYMGMVIAGVLLVLLFSAREEKSWGGRLGWGAYNVYGVSSWIGDVVSFARLTALAMSGGFIGYAVNLIASMLMGSIPGFALSLVVLVVFHLFNIFLSGLSAYVHTLRLIYVEFFGKFYEGGGIPFKRFRADSEYVDIQ